MSYAITALEIQFSSPARLVVETTVVIGGSSQVTTAVYSKK
jgi:hypothetical protein